MRAMLKAFPIALALMISGHGGAWADSCFRDSAADTLVGTGFLLPTKGKCKPFSGYFASAAGLITGTACGTSDNQKIKFYLSYGEFNVQWSSAALIVLDRATLAGTVQYCFINGHCNPTFSISQIVCPTASARPFE